MSKRCYFVSEDDEGVAVVATTPTDAKKLAWRGETFNYEYTDLRARLVKNADIEGLDYGIIEPGIDGLRRNAYWYVTNMACPICDRDDETLFNEDGKIGCMDCVETGAK